jgi:hypothetical protein
MRARARAYDAGARRGGAVRCASRRGWARRPEAVSGARPARDDALAGGDAPRRWHDAHGHKHVKQ